MKKYIAMLLALVLCLSVAGCKESFDPAAKSEGVMTYAEYDAAAIDAEVVIEAPVAEAPVDEEAPVSEAE